jgi:DNA-binding GntR family transcriptional regulator
MFHYKPLSTQVEAEIKQRIHKGVYRMGSSLPPENNLATELGVSRGTVRSAYNSLRAKGIITIRHGIGAFVISVPSIANPYEENEELDELIALQGYQPGFYQLKAEIISANQYLSNLLEIDPGSDVLEIYKVFTADEDPIIIFINHFPAWIFQDKFKMHEAFEPSVTEPPDKFLLIYCNIRMMYFHSTIVPEIVSNVPELNTIKFKNLNEKLLLVENIGFDDQERKVLHSIEHLIGVAARFELNRSIIPPTLKQAKIKVL